MEHPTHECEENLNRLTIYYTGENWATIYWWITFCPFCGVKLEKPESPEPPDVKIGVSQKALNVWHARLFRAHALLVHDDLKGCRADGDIVGVLDQIGEVLDGQPPQSLARKRIASYALIEDWYRRLREVADDECSWSGARKMLRVTNHMRALLNCYREEPEPPPAKVEPEPPASPDKIEVSWEMLEKWRRTLLHLTNALDVRCPLQSGNFCEPVAYAFGDAHDVLSGINKALADINKTEEPCRQSDRE